jgi:hypothetical protein
VGLWGQSTLDLLREPLSSAAWCHFVRRLVLLAALLALALASIAFENQTLSAFCSTNRLIPLHLRDPPSGEQETSSFVSQVTELFFGMLPLL